MNTYIVVCVIKPSARNLSRRDIINGVSCVVVSFGQRVAALVQIVDTAMSSSRTSLPDPMLISGDSEQSRRKCVKREQCSVSAHTGCRVDKLGELRLRSVQRNVATEGTTGNSLQGAK